MIMSEHMGRQLVMVIDGGVGEGRIQVGTVQELAELIRYQELGDYGVTEVFALSQLNELKRVHTRVTGGDKFDENDLATATVTVVFPDGAREWSTYQVDGRA
jgi:hypothetical protein